MNKVININLDGNAYQLEEGGYDVLHAYLDTAAARLQGNPDRDEILSDIERAIAEKFRARLGSHKTVVVAREVAAALAELGPVEADGGENAGPGPGNAGAGGNNPGGRGPAREETAPPPGGTPKRLYRLTDGAMLSGVCNGIAAYADVDPTFIRLAFVGFTVLGGAGILAYLVLALVIPEARTPEEKAAAAGGPSTAQEFIRRAKAGYYETMKEFPDHRARREWARRFRREMRANARQWRHHWRWHAGPGCPPDPATGHPGMGFTLPFLSLLQGVIKILWVCALISLLASGRVFGLSLGSLPVWGAIVLLALAYGILVSPLQAARHACSSSMNRSHWPSAFIFLVDAVIWLIMAAVLLCLAIHYFPELRAAIQSLPAVLHQAADDIRTWWKGKS